MKILKIFLVLISFSICLNADDDYDDYEKHKKYEKIRPYYGFDYLQLNNQQKLELKDILISHKKSYKRFYKLKHEKLNELEKLFKQNSFDIKKYEEIIAQLNSFALDMEITNLKKIHNLLDEKQREIFSYNIKEWRVE